MKKALMLIGTYLVATVAGGLIGVAVWPEPSRLSDLPGFLILAPLFQLVSVLGGLNPASYGQPIQWGFLGPFLLLVFILMSAISAVFFWKSERKWLLLVFALPALISSLQGTNLLCEAIAW